MSKASERLRRLREARKQLTEINEKRDNVVIIHYEVPTLIRARNFVKLRQVFLFKFDGC